MNDPHVVALLYQIDHGRSVDYRDAKPIDREEEGFCVKVENERVRFEFKEHYATEGAARKAIEDYIRAWEFSAGLRGGPKYFKLKFDHAQIKDRKPTPGVMSLSAHFRAGVPTMTATLTVSPPCYPPPPSGLKITPDVQTMYERYIGYLQGREPLPSMAYFCWTMTKGSPTIERDFSEGVRNKVSRLSSEKGGQQARKALGTNKPLTAQESRFLEEAIKAVIRRAAKRAHAPTSNLPKISLSDFPSV